MHSATPHSLLVGSAASVIFLAGTMVPEVPTIVQWTLALLSATASVLTIIKNSHR